MAQASAWEQYRELTAHCQHFNGLQSTYRTLASTWLLAAFGAMGFVLKDLGAAYDVYRAHLIWGISLAAAGGLMLLWLLDLRVYHRLLEAVFAELLKLEHAHPGLPGVANGMARPHRGGGVGPKTLWFYLGPIVSLTLIATLAPLLALLLSTPPVARDVWILGVLAVLAPVLGGAIATYMRSSSNKDRSEFAALWEQWKREA